MLFLATAGLIRVMFTVPLRRLRNRIISARLTQLFPRAIYFIWRFTPIMTEHVSVMRIEPGVNFMQTASIRLPMTLTAPTRPRRLRIGYLSYEYATHVTSFYFEPLARRHDRERFEVFCYAGNEKDGTTERLSRFVDHWVDISSLDAEAVARRIKEDNIHILISTSSYLAKHRLPLAYRPAPVQVCYHNRVATTGLTAVDYLITEELVDPAGETDDLYSEKLVRLTHRCCYSAPAAGPDLGRPQY